MKKVHITKTRCWTCVHLRKNLFTDTYKCIQNKMIPEFVLESFGEACEEYAPRKQLVEEIQRK